MSLRWVMLVLLLLIGCREELFFVGPPPVSGTTALLIEDDGRPGLWVLSEWPSEPIRIDALDPRRASAAAVVFEGASPALLGLPEGAVTIEAQGPLTRRLPLDDPRARSFVADPEGTWRETAAADPELGELSFRDPQLCPELALDRVDVPFEEDTQGFGFGAALGDDVVVLSTLDGKVFRVDADRRVSSVELRGVVGQVSAMAAHDGELWVGTSSGSVYLGRAESPFEMSLVATSSASVLDRLVVTRSGDQVDIIVIDRDRRVWHHDGGQWRIAHRFAPDNTAFSAKDLIEVEPGHVLGVSLSEPKILRFRDRRFTIETPEELPISGFNRVYHLPGLGSLVAGTLGQLFADSTGRWEPLMTPSVSVNLGAMGAFEGGLLVATIFGGVELIYPERRVGCEHRTLPAPLRTDLITPFGEGLLLAGPSKEPRGSASLVFVRAGDSP